MGGLVKGGPVRAAQVRIAELEAELAQYRANFNAFRILLHSAKFTGAQEDGERRDWIATGDVLTWLSDTQRDALQAAAEVKQCPACGRPFTGAACGCTGSTYLEKVKGAVNHPTPEELREWRCQP